MCFLWCTSNRNENGSLVIRHYQVFIGISNSDTKAPNPYYLISIKNSLFRRFFRFRLGLCLRAKKSCLVLGRHHTLRNHGNGAPYHYYYYTQGVNFSHDGHRKWSELHNAKRAFDRTCHNTATSLTSLIYCVSSMRQ